MTRTTRPFPPEHIREFVEAGAWGTETVYDLFEKNAAAAPDRPALTDDPRKPADSAIARLCRLTYRELEDEALRTAAALHSEGLRQGDIVVVQMPNVAELIVLYLAAARLGLIVSPLPVQYREKEIADVLDTVRPAAAIVIGRYRGHAHAAMWAEATDRTTLPLMVWGTGIPEGAVGLDALIADADPAAAPPPAVTADDLFTICWTSGTEARAKAVPRTHNNWMATGKGICDGASMEPGDRLLNPFPAINVASIGGLFMTWLLTGGTLVLHMPFDLQVFLQQIAEEKVTYSVVAPALLTRLLKDRENLDPATLASLRSLGTGSAPPDPGTMAAFQERFGIAIANFFGSNEGISLCASDWDIPDPTRRAVFFPRAGRPEYQWRNRVSNWSRTRLIDIETGEEITEPGRTGEIAIAGPTVFPGYYKAGAFDRSAFTDDGYLLTGDLFEIAEEDGDPRYYRFVGRKKEIIIRGGMNVSPVEVESLLANHPDLLEVAVAGIPDPELGERIGAFVVPRGAALPAVADLSAYLGAQGLARYKHPERIMVLKALPRSPFNKVLRRELLPLAEREAAGSTDRKGPR